MLKRNNQEIIDDIFIYLSDRLGAQLYNFANVLAERDNLELLDNNAYYYIAGNLLLLKEDGSDTSNNPVIEGKEDSDKYKEQRVIVLRAMLSFLHHEVATKREESVNELIKLLDSTNRTFNREFTNILYLFVLFSSDKLYSHLCPVLAKFISLIVYNDYREHDAN